jgi:hypothetical protein
MSDKIMDRVQKLLNQAASVGLDTPEGRAFQAKADEQMQIHRIEEAALRAHQLAKGLSETKKHQPTDKIIEWVTIADEFRDTHQEIVRNFAWLTDVRLVYKGYSELRVFGYPDDIDYFQMLWVSTHLVFSGHLFPEWNKNLSAGDNIRAFAESGYKWMYIWEAARRAGQPLMRKRKGESEMEPVPAPPNDGGWMKREMAKAYRRDGLEKPQLTHGVKNYRLSYAQAFAAQIESRVADMKWTRERLARQDTSGAALVLAKDATALDDYLNKIYPPGTLGIAGPGSRQRGTHAGAAAKGREAANHADLTGGRGGVSGGSRPAIG